MRLLLLRELLLLLLRHGVRTLLMLMLTRVGMLMLVMRVRQSFVVHAGGLEGELMVPGLGLRRVLERRVGMIGMVICGRVEVGSGEVEQAVLLGEVEVLHCAWCSGFDGQYTRESR